jgi:hypothetical protein
MELLRKSATVFAAVEAIRENRGAEYGAVWSRPALRLNQKEWGPASSPSLTREVSEIN